ncbi:MAG: Gfo/Idh/MocA family oxidoreductase [Tepidiformaceae bacterium]
MPQPVVGLIGCGHIGQFHSRNLRGSLRSELVPGEYSAVCDRVVERAESFAGIIGAKTVTADAETVFATPRLNAIYICTETAEHPALVKRAAELGLAIFCEKPLAKTLGDVREMVEAVERAGVVNQVGLVLRYSPVFTVLKEMLSAPDLGPLLTAHLRDDQFFPVRGHYGSSWRGKFDRAGGGTLIEHSIHDIDLFHWLFGDIESVRCHVRYTTEDASVDPGVEDVAMATFQHAGGHQTTLSSIWHALDDRPSTRHLEVFFEGGYFATDHDFLGPIRYQGRTGPVLELSAEEVIERYSAISGLTGDLLTLATRGMYEDFAFLESVNSGQPAFPDFRTALRAHEVVDACYRSAEGSCEVNLASHS